MKEKIFLDCQKQKQINGGVKPFWGKLAKKHGYSSGEKLRWVFKNESKRRGTLGKDALPYDWPSIKRSPKILIFDIENSYTEIASWGINKQYINKGQILNDWIMISYAAKWLYDEKVYSKVLTSKESIKKTDKRICKGIRDLLEECDIAITYNGNRYDIPKLNTRLIINKISRPSPYKSIDIFQTVSRNFAFTSKSMDYVNYSLNLERKKKTEGMGLWIRCMAGEEKALSEMKTYNIQDVVALQEQYLEIRPWIKNHPNIGLWHESKEPICGFCGSTNLKYADKLYNTTVGLYYSFRCNDCHAPGRTQEKYLSKEKRKSTIRNT